MAYDGVLIHYLIKELQKEVVGKHISKVFCLNDYEYVFYCGKTKLIVSVNPSNPHIRLTELEFINSNTFLSPFFKKHIEGGLITSISQYHNDRIVIIQITNKDDLGYQKYYQIIVELTGKNTNLIIADEDLMILEAVKKTSLIDNRLILVKAKYEFLVSQKVNPFTYQKNFSDNIFEGVSSLLFSEITYCNNLNVINRPIQPTIIKTENKTYFYVFDLVHLNGERLTFNTISSMLEYFYINTSHEVLQNNDQKKLNNFITKEITKLKNKLTKQELELQDAHDSLTLEKVANILASNLHLVKPRQEEITCYDYYENQEIKIKLNPNIKPTENLNNYYNKYKKAKRTIAHLQTTIEATKNDISYYECLLQQTNLSNINDLREILSEVGISKTPVKKNSKPNILKLTDNHGNEIFIGKNNLQNEYLTHKFANSNDYFFHVVNYPGSHVIFRGILDEVAIKLTATVAAYYSKAKGPVTVDYTQVKWVKKIKGMKGSFVRYTNQKSINVTPDLDFIGNFTRPCK